MKKKTIVGLIAIVAIAMVVIFAGFVEQYDTYDKFGFSFKYPADMEVHEEGILSAEANEESGAVYCENPELIIIVKWMKMEKADTSDQIKMMNKYLEDMDADGVWESNHVFAPHMGHQLVAQRFAVTWTQEASDMLGSMGSWRCDVSGRMFHVIVLLPRQDLGYTMIVGNLPVSYKLNVPEPNKDLTVKAYTTVIKSFRCH